MKSIPQDVMFFPNGITACCDQNGEQMGKLQEPWFLLYVNFLISMGYDPKEIIFTMPNQQKVKVMPLEDGKYNWTNI